MTSLPETTLVRQFDTHRLIPSKYADESVLAKLADTDEDLRQLFDLDQATNDRLLAENGMHSALDVRELVVDVPCARIVNAAFCHPHPQGSRFNGPARGAWYAGFAVETSQAEVVYHRSVELDEIGGGFELEVTYTSYLADFSAEFHDIRQAPSFAACLDPRSYVASQQLAERLLDQGSLGIVFPSVRDPGGTCLACYRPAVVGNVRKGSTYAFRFQAKGPVEVRLVGPAA